MYCAGEDCAKHDPEKCSRSKHYAHDGTENRSESGDIQKLYQKNFPCRHRQIVDIVTSRIGWSAASRVNSENMGDKCPVKEIAGYECDKSDDKSLHRNRKSVV